jgi:hypothetical protein
MLQALGTCRACRRKHYRRDTCAARGAGAVSDVIFADTLFPAGEPESVVDKLTRFLARPSAGC